MTDPLFVFRSGAPKRLMLFALLAVGAGGLGCADQVVGPETSSEETATQALAPKLDQQFYATPKDNTSPLNVDIDPDGTNGGPADNCEIDILREQSWTTTPPTTQDSANNLDTGVTLGSTPDDDGLYSQSVMVRCGPTVPSGDRNCG